MDESTVERRREIVEVFQSLPLKQNHFEVLGVEPGCSDDEVKRAYITLAKRYHPDANRDKRLNDLHDMLEAIIIRVGEAWEVIGEAKSRASYESARGDRAAQRSSGPSDANGRRGRDRLAAAGRDRRLRAAGGNPVQGAAPADPGALLGRDPDPRVGAARDGAPQPAAPRTPAARARLLEEPQLAASRRRDAAAS